MIQNVPSLKSTKIHIHVNNTQKKLNQWACYNRSWSWPPMPCEKHGPRASVTTINLGLRTRVLSTESLGPCFSHGMGDHAWSNPTTYNFRLSPLGTHVSIVNVFVCVSVFLYSIDTVLVSSYVLCKYYDIRLPHGLLMIKIHQLKSILV